MFHHRNAGGGTSGPRRGAVVWRLVWTWVQTLLGTAVMGALVATALYYFGVPLTWGALFLSLWMVIPIVGWYYSAQIVRRLTGCRGPDPLNPEHLRVLLIVDRLFPKTGLRRKPPVYISPLPVPNAFATGRTPGQAFIAVTDGLLRVGLTDAELEAVIAHELAHVRNYDVALNSTLAALGSLFSLLLAVGLPGLFAPSAFASSRAPLLDELSRRVKERKQRFYLPAGGMLGFLTMLILFYLVSYFVKFVSLFVTRVRESAADAQAVLWTGNPCALSTALQKIVVYVITHADDLRSGISTRGLTPLWLVSPLAADEFGSGDEGLLGALRRWWRGLGENHPPIRKRLDDIDRMSGKACPRVV